LEVLIAGDQVATLLLTTHGLPVAEDEPVTLRAWLREDWAILFSHPGDFVRCELEMDRWLAVVQRAFAGCRIRPLALASSRQGAEEGWVTQVSGDSRVVVLEPPFVVNERAGDLRAAALHQGIGGLVGRRFVMVIDSTLASRRTFTYGGLSDVPSPLELLGWADATRTRHVEEPPMYPSPVRHHRQRLAGEARRGSLHAI
jgi:alkyl hydroperoxide reductase subunit AhpC